MRQQIKKAIHRGMILLFLISMIIGSVGCSKISDKMVERKESKLALDYLESKYGKKFEIKRIHIDKGEDIELLTAEVVPKGSRYDVGGFELYKVTSDKTTGYYDKYLEIYWSEEIESENSELYKTIFEDQYNVLVDMELNNQFYERSNNSEIPSYKIVFEKYGDMVKLDFSIYKREEQQVITEKEFAQYLFNFIVEIKKLNIKNIKIKFYKEMETGSYFEFDNEELQGYMSVEDVSKAMQEKIIKEKDIDENSTLQLE